MSSGARDASDTPNAAPRVVDLGRPDVERKVSAFELERFHAGELDAERRREIEALLASDEALSAELSALRARDAAFRTAMPFERFSSDHDARLHATSGVARLRTRWRELRWSLGGGAVVAAAAAALALAVLVPGNDPSVELTDDARQTRLKGSGARIGFFVQSGAGARWGNDGEELRAGDRIQLAVQDPARARSVVILGIDGRAQVSTYLARRLPSGTPKGDGEAAPRLLDQSLVLDVAVGAERFFVLYAADADVDALECAALDAARELSAQVSSGESDLRRVERLPLSLDGVEQGSVHIVKVAE